MPRETTEAAQPGTGIGVAQAATVPVATTVVAIGALPVLRVLAGDAAGPRGRIALSWLVLAIVLGVLGRCTGERQPSRHRTRVGRGPASHEVVS